MKLSITTPAIGGILYLTIAFFLAAYFAFSAIQGNHGIFKRIQAEAQVEELQKHLNVLEIQLAKMENKTRRLSDNFLDLDLLDERARKVLGMARADEIIIN
ncbi:MAG: septum formation initiator precursor [Rhodobacteraceae bacterium]|nr:septum formation initiator precursor [Paracoccaceae bacterium]RZO36867.1 MAG: septum formation initiator family protein [Paracoccaceae bacterium]